MKEKNEPPKSQIAANVRVLEKITRLTGSGLSRMPFTSSDCRIEYIRSKPWTTGDRNNAGTPDWPSLVSPSMVVSVFVGRRLTMTLLPPAFGSLGVYRLFRRFTHTHTFLLFVVLGSTSEQKDRPSRPLHLVMSDVWCLSEEQPSKNAFSFTPCSGKWIRFWSITLS